ncbi:hypothetical protein IGB42_04279 [Andreprevotia sp. IGB-42]|nr:hypothetical protein IGB42_04279 [Andreprevotia sp. IGB-42]
MAGQPEHLQSKHHPIQLQRPLLTPAESQSQLRNPLVYDQLNSQDEGGNPHGATKPATCWANTRPTAPPSRKPSGLATPPLPSSNPLPTPPTPRSTTCGPINSAPRARSPTRPATPWSGAGTAKPLATRKRTRTRATPAISLCTTCASLGSTMMRRAVGTTTTSGTMIRARGGMCRVTRSG